MSSSQYSPTPAATSTNANSDSEGSVIALSPPNPIQKGKQPVDYNSINFKFEPDNESPIYIFAAGLFTRTLLPIKHNEERHFTIKCTT